jgi:uroporphyrinogen decarboxylase
MGVNVLNPLQPECMDNLTIKHQYGDHLSFWCGVSTQNILPYGTPEEVFSEALKIKEAMGKNGGFIFAPSQSIQTDVPLENLDALVRAGKQIA